MSQELQLLNELNSDLTWFKDNFKELEKHYDNRFIAIRNGKILSENKDLEKLMKDLKKKKIDSADVLVQFVSSIPTIF